MIIVKCPLRISLVGGSTDLDAFLNENEYGSVVSFPCNLYTYITLHENNRNKYIINYSRKEECDNIDEIDNDIAKVALEYFKVGPVTLTFNTDLFSDGSGMGSSSSYMIAAIKALSLYTNANLSNFEICKLAVKLEKKFNPFTGHQDSYGCGMTDFKRIHFFKDRDPSFNYYNLKMFENFDMFLLYTNIKRESNPILKDIDVAKTKNQLSVVEDMERAVNNGKLEQICTLINKGWDNKKKTSTKILVHQFLRDLDIKLQQSSVVKAFKLCGAGGGGYFFIMTDKNSSFTEEFKEYEKLLTQVEMSKEGLAGRIF